MRLILPLLAALLAACGSVPRQPPPERVAVPPAPTSAKPPYVLKHGGGFYKDDGPGDNAPANLDAVPDAVPKDEPLHRFANRPYSVLGRDYVPLRDRGAHRERGVASWYGKKFHGQKTSSGETYDMYGMTAAHPTLPIPSYARVTNPASGKSVVVRINDRGPFHAGRIIDLSYTAAWKLGYIGNGSTQVELESIPPGTLVAVSPVPQGFPPVTPTFDDDPIARFADLPPPAAAPAAAAPAAAETRGIFMQLGAFGNPDNAEAFRAHIARELDWAGDMLRTQVAGTLHRVQLGPYASRAEAESMAEKVRAALGVKPAIVVR
jgi:rare lipoprotein A